MSNPNPDMTVGAFLNFGIENAKRHWLKFIGLMIFAVIVLLVCTTISFVLVGVTPNAVKWLMGAITSLLMLVIFIAIAFGFLKNILNLCRGEQVDLMVFTKVKPATIVNFVIACTIMGIAIMIGFVFLIIPGVILALLFLHVPYLIIDRDMGVADAFKESVSLSKDRLMDIFVGFLVGNVVANILSMFIITLVFTIPMAMFINVYPYLCLTGQLDEAKKKLEAAAGASAANA